MAKPHTSTRVIGAELVATLMHGPRTKPELIEQIGTSDTSATNWLTEYMASGVVRIVEWRKPLRGRHVAIYGLQTKPFDLPSAERPPTRAQQRASHA